MSDRLDNFDSRVPGHYGAAQTGVTLCEATFAAAWNVQGDPARRPFVAGVAQIFGVPLPLSPNSTTLGKALLALWLGPRSWLLIESAPSQRPSTLTDFTTKRDALNAQGGALFEVTASRVAFRIGGAHAGTVLATNCPLDFHPDVFRAGGCAQSMFGHINALYYRPDATPTFLVQVARSLARDGWRQLCRSSAQYGFDIEPPRSFVEPR